jgi:alpha-ribazole phosphatase
LIYLIRHTTPLVVKGTCYGQSDLDITPTFEQEAIIIKNVLPPNIEVVYSSPLQRCSKLANFLFNNATIIHEPKLMELHCGDWEMQNWDDIPKHEIDPWMNDFVNVQIPNGESYTMLYDRIVGEFDKVAAAHQNEKVAIVAHGGVLRSILSYITNTPLINSFDAFKIHYGAVFALQKNNSNFTFAYDILSNIETPKEQHKPSNI